MGKNNLDSIQIKEGRVLPAESSLKAKRGRANKPIEERESEALTLKITPKELATLKGRAGELIPLGTLVKHILRTQTDLFTKPGSKES